MLDDRAAGQDVISVFNIPGVEKPALKDRELRPSASLFDSPTVHVNTLADAAKVLADRFQQLAAAATYIQHFLAFDKRNSRLRQSFQHFLTKLLPIRVAKLMADVLVIQYLG